MLALDNNGNFVVDTSNHLTATSVPLEQNFKSEVRCIQETWVPDSTFGRNTLVWTLSQSISDRCLDLTRIGTKYMTVQSVMYDSVTKEFAIQAQG